MTTPTFHSLVLEMLAITPGSLPPTTGELAHAAFYAAIRAADPALSAQMHDAETRKDFTLSPLQFAPRESNKHEANRPQRKGDVRIPVHVGQQAWLRICLLNNDLFDVFMQHLLNSALPSIRLGEVSFAVTQVYGAPGSHPWSGYCTLDDLRAMQTPIERWSIDFVSPTCFSWGKADNDHKRLELFPLPRMLVANLRSRWDKLSGESWGKAFEEWVERNVIVTRIENWHSEPFAFSHQTFIGGTGTVSYRLLDLRDAPSAIHLHRLLRLAFFTGIGYKTTHGMGQVRILSTNNVA